ncbi:hypothetical protein MHB81_25680 [Paenibacillus sp. FSL H7-0326]
MGFKRWLEQGENIDHPAVRSILKTMRNWQEEIVKQVFGLNATDVI